MYKVSEIAEKLNVTRQGVYYWIKKLDKELKPHLYKRDGATVVDDEGLELLKEKMESKEDFTGDSTEEENNSGNASANGELLDYIETLKNQLNRKDEQIDKLTDLVQNSQVLIRENQQRIEQLEGEVKEQKESWWERLKWWG